MKQSIICAAMAILLSCAPAARVNAQSLKLNDKGYLEKRGVNVMVYSNPFSAAFYDEKRSGIDIIHHGVLTITNGGVRLTETPEQWDLVPEMEGREVNAQTGEVDVKLIYNEYNFRSQIKVTPKGDGFTIGVYLDDPLPAETEGKACFNLEFLPSAYWNHSYIADGKPCYFPRYAGTDTELRPLADKALQINNLITADLRGRDVTPVAKPLAKANKYVLAPDDPERKCVVSSDTEIQLYDGRILSQNGWFVLHSFLPAGKTGKVLEWYVEPNSIKDWTRKPVIGFSQVGYTPSQKKESIIELDPEFNAPATLKVNKVSEDGSVVCVKEVATTEWGRYLRYNYVKADFSDVTEPGIYFLEYGDQQTNIFPIAADVYAGVWKPTIDIWFPEQMDHMECKEGYRVWHNAPHMDDAVQAPTDTPHFDMFEQGHDTQSPFKPFEFVDGFDKGGWFDAGDWDIESHSHCSVLSTFVTVWDLFKPERDETMVDQENHYVNIHFADGRNDLLQQIEHGVYPIVNMVEKTGHACRGINHPTLYQYNRLDEPSTITDNKHLTGDERWFFTYSTPGLENQFCSALAACARALKDFNPELSKRCLDAAVMLYDNYVAKAQWPGMGLQCQLQLYLTTGSKKYLKGFEEQLLQNMERMATMPQGRGRRGGPDITLALQAAPYMSKGFIQKIQPYVEQFKAGLDSKAGENPYGVEVYGGSWGSTGQVVNQGISAYWANRYFPEIVGKEYIYRSADFIFGCHPFSNLSFVTGVGVKPKNVNYGNNRADFSFIPGALVPGFLLLQPDYIECKDDWPFFWGQNEATISGNAGYYLFGNILSNISE